MDINQQDMERQLQTPEVSREKKFFPDAKLLLPEKIKSIELAILDRKIAVQNGIDINKAKTEEFKQFNYFYLASKEVMRNLKPHLALKDKEDFNKNWRIVEDTLRQEIYSLDAAEELSEFLVQEIFNAGLSDVSKPVPLVEILSEIDISEL
jgi:hypothetical protein